MSARLAVHGLVKRFADGRRVVDDVSFEVGAGEVVAVVGESGSGTIKALASACRTSGFHASGRSIMASTKPAAQSATTTLPPSGPSQNAASNSSGAAPRARAISM